MSPRLVLALSGVLALAAVGAAWHFHRQAREAAQRTAAAARENADLRFELKQTRERADDLAAKLSAADTQLGSAKTRATATETRSAQLARELSTVRATLTEREQREVALMAELENVRRQSRAESPAPAPVVASTPPPAPEPVSAPPSPASPPVDVAPYQRRIAELEAQLLELLTRALADLGPTPSAPEPPAPARRATPPQVVEVGAGGAFVVIDRGTQHGLRPGDVCAFTRDGTELALGRLSEVRPRFAIVQLLPGASKGQLQAGDIAVLAN